MDAESVHALSRICAAGRCARRIQRQIHVQSICAARRIVRYAGQSHQGNLSQFLSARGALAIQRYSPGERFRRRTI